MATATTSSSQNSAVSEEFRRSVDEASLNKMKCLVDRLRLENATLQQSLDTERSGVRALKAQHESTLRALRTDYRKKEEFLENQLRTLSKPEKPYEEVQPGCKMADLKKLTVEVQLLKASNKSLQEKVKVAQAAESARAAELRAQVARHAALEQAAHRDARAQVRKLLEEIKSKERIIIQLRRAAPAPAPQEPEQAQRMECGATELGRKLRSDQGKDKSDREDLKTDIRHRKETFYRESSDLDSAVSSAPHSLSPQPHADMWSCGQCRAAGERAESAARENTRLSDSLRDARDQLELLEFRLLELEDAAPDKGARDNLTDSDSGCVSPGSRIKDSASPEFRRMDSGYKSPAQTPCSPCNPRRHLGTPHLDEFSKTDEFVGRSNLLAEIMDRNNMVAEGKSYLLAELLDKNLASSEASDSLKSNPVKEHLEQMILNAESAEDRSCLEQLLVLLYNFQALSSSVSDDECYQIKPKKLCDIKATPKIDTDVPSSKIQKAIATVTPYSTQSSRDYKCESLESLCSNEPKKSNNSLLQESGIFEGVETETKCTQTDVFENYEGTGDLNTEIQRLNSIREKLEKQGVSRNKNFTSKLQSDESEGLECRCVKLGKKHKQYYERRLKFLEGKISIYEAAQDVKNAKLAQRLQKEYLLENRVQDLESQISTLQDKLEGLEEECCELEEIENDTRLHWQQLQMDYELCTAQLRDMSEQRECSRAQAERLMRELENRELQLKEKETELQKRLTHLEKAVPAIIAWNVVQAVGANVPPKSQRAIQHRLGAFSDNPSNAVAKLKSEAKDRAACSCGAPAAWGRINASGPASDDKQIEKLLAEKAAIEKQAKKMQTDLENQIATLKEKLAAEILRAERKQAEVNNRLGELEEKVQKQNDLESAPVDTQMVGRLNALIQSEEELKARVCELERRETAYLEMLTQADDMWAEMEGGYKQRIQDAQRTETQLTEKMQVLETEKEKIKNSVGPLKKKLRDTEESECNLRIGLEKAERDNKELKDQNTALAGKVVKTKAEASESQQAFKELGERYKKEMDGFRASTKQMVKELELQKKQAKETEGTFKSDLDKAKKDLSRTCKNVMDLDVTNSELREEVESLENQLKLTQKALAQCKRKCQEKITTLSQDLSIKTEELEELRSETMRQSLRSRVEHKPDKTEYIDDGGYTLCTAVPKKISDYGRMHHSLSYISSDTRCSCPSMRSQLVGSLVEDLFERIHNSVDEDLTKLCREITPAKGRLEASEQVKAKIVNYLLMAISKELVRSIGDADAKTDTEEWQRAVSSMTYSLPSYGLDGLAAELASLGRLEGNAGVLHGAARLASVSCACAAARLCTALPELSDCVKTCQEEVLEHGDVKVMEEQLANAIESIVNCPSCALGTNAIVWSTDV